MNNLVWNLLSPHMQTVDAKMQTIQESIIKVAAIVTKVLNLASDRLSAYEIESGTDDIGLLGQQKINKY